MIGIYYMQIINLRAIWWIINKKTGKTSLNKQDIKIIRNSEEITNPENIFL
jgi:hypothetical protein